MAIVIDQAYIPIWILEMFETPPERPTVVATHYGPSHCLVMFASEMPGGKQYPNRLLLDSLFGIQVNTSNVQMK